MFINEDGVSQKWKWMILGLRHKRDFIHVELVFLNENLLVTKWFPYIAFPCFWFPMRKQNWPWWKWKSYLDRKGEKSVTHMSKARIEKLTKNPSPFPKCTPIFYYIALGDFF
jgi:hypothetical protein